MKLLKSSGLMLLILGLFVGFLAGMYAGRSTSGDSIRIEVSEQRATVPEKDTQLSARDIAPSTASAVPSENTAATNPVQAVLPENGEEPDASSEDEPSSETVNQPVSELSEQETVNSEAAEPSEETTEPSVMEETPQTEAVTPETAPSAWYGGRLDINSASVSELMQLPGIGEVLAQRIVEFRQANGPFHSVEELTDVSGIGSKKMDAVRDMVTVR